MHKMTFFPLGNADCCRIELECGSNVLVDFAATSEIGNDDDDRCDLPDLLRADLKDKGRDNFDVVAFSHLDKDHFKGATDFFHLEYAKKYQGEGRIKMDVIWVPAALITEASPDDEEARILQKEARHRFRKGKGIRVFSRPERLKEWCEKNDVKLEKRLHLITNAGEFTPEFSLEKDQVEFFVHSPFAVRQDDNTLEDRNEDSIVLQATFEVQNIRTHALLLADSTHEVLSQIVEITEAKRNSIRLEWDIVKLPHHCSYLSIGPKKGKNKTTPDPKVARLYEEKGQDGAIAVSTSNPIPLPGTEEDNDSQPPHRQAARYYQDVLSTHGGQFVVTMDKAPKPVVIEIDGRKATLKKSALSAGYVATSQRAPRAG